MKRKMMIGVLILLLFFSSTGCSNIFDDGIDNITIYTLDREVFLEFLQENDKRYLVENCTDSMECETIDQFNTSGGFVFYINDVFCNYMNSARALGKLLAEYEIDEKVVDVAIIDVAHMPLSAWVKTDKNAYFVTINESYNERFSHAYTYRLYTQSEYLERFDHGDARLTVNGESVSAFPYVQICAEHADIPLEAVLSCLGATSQKINNDDMQKEITFLGETYILDKRNVTLLDKDNTDIFFRCYENGEPCCIYQWNGFVYVDSVTIGSTLDTMGMPIDVTYDPDTNVLDISPRIS